MKDWTILPVALLAALAANGCCQSATPLEESDPIPLMGPGPFQKTFIFTVVDTNRRLLPAAIDQTVNEWIATNPDKIVLKKVISSTNSQIIVVIDFQFERMRE